MATLISFAGGDLQYNGRSSHAWKDAELPCAKAVGQVELLKANHHGVTNTNQVDALKALNPQTIVVNSLGRLSSPYRYTEFDGDNTPCGVTCLSLTSGRAIAPGEVETTRVTAEEAAE